jgi:hypothetical protein
MEGWPSQVIGGVAPPDTPSTPAQTNKDSEGTALLGQTDDRAFLIVDVENLHYLSQLMLLLLDRILAGERMSSLPAESTTR